MQRLLLIAGLTLASVGALGSLALGDDGGLMQRMMGHDSYTSMVDQMRAALGAERASAMLAQCEAAMSGADMGAMTGSSSGMGEMMSGMRGMRP